MRTRAVVAGLLTAALALGVVVTPNSAERAAAADLSTFDPGLIITDEIFYDEGTMSAAAIQSWLEAMDPDCVSYTSGSTKYTCMADFSMSTRSKTASANCDAYAGKSSESAATIIYKVAQACGINPKVILVTLQKEQGLITAGPKSSSVYRIAMGYGCPDTAACDTNYYGFQNQVFSASWQFQQYRRSPGSYNHQAGRYNTIRYNPKESCGSASVYIRSQATAGLYNYTPYVPNSAALSAGYGLGDSCSAYGNRNFFNYFSDWFGNPANLLKNASFQDLTERWKSGSSGSISLAAYTNADNAHSGKRYAVVKTAVAGRQLVQSISRNTKVGQVYTAGVWLRAVDADTTVEGLLRLSTVGGTADTASVPFSVGTTWTYFTTDVAIEHPDHTGLRWALELTTTDTDLRVDTTELYLGGSQESRRPLRVEQTAVEGGTNGGWVRNTTSGFSVKRAYVVGAVEGKYYLKMSSTTSGRYLYQRLPRNTKTGQSYTTGMWLRAASETETFRGRLRLLAMGGTTESSTTDFEVGPEWTYVTTTLDIGNPSHKSLRIQVFLDDASEQLLMDAITATPNLLVRDSSFETGTSALNPLPATTSATWRDATALGSVTAPDGQGALLVAVSADDSYLRLDRSRILAPGQEYSVSIWVKSAVEGISQAGVLSLEARNSTGVSENSSTPFTATDEWTLVTVQHTVLAAGADRLRAQLALDTSGSQILVDGFSLL